MRILFLYTYKLYCDCIGHYYGVESDTSPNADFLIK